MENNNVQNLDTVGNEKQYIVVRLGSEQYGIDIQYVDNIVRNPHIKKSFCTPYPS